MTENSKLVWKSRPNPETQSYRNLTSLSAHGTQWWDSAILFWSTHGEVKTQGSSVPTAKLNFVAMKWKQALLHFPKRRRVLTAMSVVNLPTSNNISSKTAFNIQVNHKEDVNMSCPLPTAAWGNSNQVDLFSIKRCVSEHSCVSLTCIPQDAEKTVCKVLICQPAGSGPMWYRPCLRWALKCILNPPSSPACAHTECLTGNKCSNYIHFCGI